MVHISKHKLVAKRGQANILHGTDQDDEVSIHKGVKAHGTGASNAIHLYDGDDQVWIGGQMRASCGGYNAIFAGDGYKNITIKCGMEAKKGGINEIVLADDVAHFTATHHLTIGAVKAADKGQNIIATGDGDDYIAFTGHFCAQKDGHNIVRLGDGTKILHFAKGLDANHGGQNIIDLGVGNQTVTFGGSVDAGRGGKNQITSAGGNVFIHVKCDLDAVGVNDISLGEGPNKINIDGNMIAHSKGINRIFSEGETKIVIGGAMKSHGGFNQIETGWYDDQIIIHKGLSADCGNNQISTGEGNDRVTIKGKIKASHHNTNIINTGEGNDVIYLDAHVGKKDLIIDAGEGYDVLILSAANEHKFKHQYQGWFSDLYHSSALAHSGLEEVRVDLDCGLNLGKIDWLTQMVNQFNKASGDDLSISLALDRHGSEIDIADLFTKRDESAISILDLTGSHHNELRIHNTLAANGYDGDQLRINGDGNDRVAIDNLWSLSGGFVHENENYYNVWTNSHGESLLIQDGIDIHVY